MFPTRAIEIDKIDYTMCLTIVIQETVSHNGERATDGSVINVPPWPSASGLELAADKPPTAARPIKMRFGHDHRGAHRFQLRGRAPGTTFEVRDGAWYATHKNRTQLRPLRLFRGNVPTPRAGGGRLSTPAFPLVPPSRPLGSTGCFGPPGALAVSLRGSRRQSNETGCSDIDLAGVSLHL
jgi:hypothetical protein